MKLDSHFNTILITGINGFTGIHLEKYFSKKGFKVFGTVTNKPLFKNHFTCDIRNKDEVSKLISYITPNYVIHSAAISFVGENNTSLFYDVNVVGTEHILSALSQSKVKPYKVIVVSSATVYGNQDQELLDESMCPKPINHYGISKLAMEYGTKNHFDTLDIIIARPFNYTGRGQEAHFLIPKIVNHFKEKKSSISLGNISVKREFNDINYICEVYYRLLVSNIKSDTINIASNRGIKLLDVIDNMQQIAGYEIEIKVNSTFIRKNEIPSLTGSIKKLNKQLGKIEQKTFFETLKDMYED